MTRDEASAPPPQSRTAQHDETARLHLTAACPWPDPHAPDPAPRSSASRPH